MYFVKYLMISASWLNKRAVSFFVLFDFCVVCFDCKEKVKAKKVQTTNTVKQQTTAPIAVAFAGVVSVLLVPQAASLLLYGGPRRDRWSGRVLALKIPVVAAANARDACDILGVTAALARDAQPPPPPTPPHPQWSRWTRSYP